MPSITWERQQPIRVMRVTPGAHIITVAWKGGCKVAKLEGCVQQVCEPSSALSTRHSGCLYQPCQPLRCGFCNRLLSARDSARPKGNGTRLSAHFCPQVPHGLETCLRSLWHYNYFIILDHVSLPRVPCCCVQRSWSRCH